MAYPTITIDIGTTSIKLCLFGADSQLVTSARSATPTLSDGIGEIYDVPALLSAVTSFIRGLGPPALSTVRRVAITGVGESGGLVRPDLSLASPMILWHDQRGIGYLAGLDDDDRRLLYRTTGLPVSGNYGLSKAAWAVEQAVDANGSMWLNIAEYVAAVMSGERWSEPSLASRTMALDLHRGEWSAEVCGLVGLDVDVFPVLRPAAQGAPVSSEFAASATLHPEVRIHVAGHDHMVGAVGAELTRGELLNSTGTTEGLLFLRETPDLDTAAQHSKLANGLACTGSDFTLFASIPTGGSAFATLQRMLGVGPDRVGDCLGDLHRRYLGGQIDLAAMPLVLPQFRGSPPPTKDNAARGLIAGLRSDTSWEDIVFGCFLGLVLQFAEVSEMFQGPVDRIKVIGPASGNPLWLQLKADLLGTPLTVSRFPEVVSRGAQALACGVESSWDGNDPYDVDPDTDRHRHLHDWRTQVRSGWNHLKGFPS